MLGISMPATEAASTEVLDERNSYEFAFHVLPTVAEGEATQVFEDIKAQIVKAGGEITISEAPERFELAYEIEKHLEGKNRSFRSAYFGWVRFKAPSDAVAGLTDAMETRTDLLRTMVIKLTKVEEMHPFYFHEALASQKVVTNVDEDGGSVEETVDAEEDGVATGEDSEESESAGV